MGISASSLLYPAGPAAATPAAAEVSDTVASDNLIVSPHKAGTAHATTTPAGRTGGAAGAAGEGSTKQNYSPAVVDKNKGTVRDTPKRRKVDSLQRKPLKDKTDTTVSARAKTARKSEARNEPNGEKCGKNTNIDSAGTASGRSANNRGRTAPVLVSGVAPHKSAGPVDVLGWETAFSAACSRQGSPPSSRRLAARTRLKFRDAAAGVTSSSSPKNRLPAVPLFQPNASDTTKEGRGTNVSTPGSSAARRSSRKTRGSPMVALLSPRQQSSPPARAKTDALPGRRSSKRKRSPSPPPSSTLASPSNRTRPPPPQVAASRDIGCRNDSEKTKPKKGGRGATTPTSRRQAAATRRLRSSTSGSVAAVGGDDSVMSPSRDNDALPEVQSWPPACVVGCCPSQNVGFWEGSPGVGGCTLPPCGEEGCLAPASFGFMESGRVDVCKKHVSVGMVDLLNARCGMKGCACRHRRPSNARGVRSSTLWSSLGDETLDQMYDGAV